MARTKTYSAETGYVYQYVYRGYHESSEQGFGVEYVFQATRDRQNYFTIVVRLLNSALAQCASTAGRELLSAERYALAKMTLFEALDSLPKIEDFKEPLVPDAASMERHLTTLGRLDS